MGAGEGKSKVLTLIVPIAQVTEDGAGWGAGGTESCQRTAAPLLNLTKWRKEPSPLKMGRENSPSQTNLNRHLAKVQIAFKTTVSKSSWGESQVPVSEGGGGSCQREGEQMSEGVGLLSK